MRIAFVYAGQGSQKPGMGLDLYEKEKVFRDMFAQTDSDGEIRKLCFYGTKEELSQTENTQKCMVAFAVAMTALLKEYGLKPEIVAGLSLGEYSALNAAGVLNAKTTVELAAYRGKMMAEAAKAHPGKMMAILGMERNQLQAIVKQVSQECVVTIANYNCPGQMVISGEDKAVQKVADMAVKSGAGRCIPLAVSGAFHSILMESAAIALKEKFVHTDFDKMQCPVIFNCTANQLSEEESIPLLLEKQVKSSIYFEDTILYMREYGIDTIVEIGPGKVLSGFIRKTAPEISTYALEDIGSFEEAIQTLKGMKKLC